MKRVSLSACALVIVFGACSSSSKNSPDTGVSVTKLDTGITSPTVDTGVGADTAVFQNLDTGISDAVTLTADTGVGADTSIIQKSDTGLSDAVSPAVDVSPILAETGGTALDAFPGATDVGATDVGATDAGGASGDASGADVPNRPPVIVSEAPTQLQITLAPSPSFTRIELVPKDVGSTSSSTFSKLPTSDPALFGLTGTDIRKVNFDTTPAGETIASGTTLTNEYASIGVEMENIRVVSDVYGGAASPPNATTSPFQQGFEQRFRFTVPVVAVGVINTSPDQDRFEFYSTTGELIYSTRDQDDQSGPNYNIDRFVGARTTNDRLIGSMLLVNASGQIELDEMIFEVSTATLAHSTLTYKVVAADPDGDVLSFRLVGGPEGAAIDAATGVLTWNANNLQAGTHVFVVEVSDGRGGVATQTFTVTIQVTGWGIDGGDAKG